MFLCTLDTFFVPRKFAFPLTVSAAARKARSKYELHKIRLAHRLPVTSDLNFSFLSLVTSDAFFWKL